MLFKRFAQCVLAAVVVLSVSCLALEGLYRLYKLSRYGMVDYPDYLALGILEPSPVYGHLPARNFKSEDIPAKIRHHPKIHDLNKPFNFNSLRYRGPEFEIKKPPGTYRIVAFGGSTTMTLALGDHELWTAELERLLEGDPAFLAKKKTTNVEVINAGVPGWRTREGLLRLKNEVSGFEPDLILIAFNWNDPGGAGGDPEQVREHKRPWWYPIKIMHNLQVRYSILQSGNSKLAAAKIRNLAEDRRWEDAYRRNIMEMIDVAGGLGARTLLVDLPGLCRSSAEGAIERELVIGKTRVTSANYPYWIVLKEHISGVLKDLGREKSVGVVDGPAHFDGFAGERRLELFQDEMHFTPKGAREVARSIYAALSSQD